MGHITFVLAMLIAPCSEAKRWTPSASVPELFPLIHYKTTTTPSSLGNSSSSDDVESNDDVPEDITLDIPDERWKLEHDSVFCRLIENTHCAGNQRHSDDQTILSPYKPTPQDVSASRLLWANSGFVDHVANWETPEKSEKKQNWPPDPSKIHHNLSDVDKRQTFMDRLRNISTVQKDFSSMYATVILLKKMAYFWLLFRDSVTEEGDIRKPLSCSEKVLENGSSTRKPKNGSPTVHLQEDSFTTQTDIPFSVPSNRRGIKALRNRVRGKSRTCRLLFYPYADRHTERRVASQTFWCICVSMQPCSSSVIQRTGTGQRTL